MRCERSVLLAFRLPRRKNGVMTASMTLVRSLACSLLAIIALGCSQSPAESEKSTSLAQAQPLTWVRKQALVSPTGVANEYFGRALAIDGDTALISAHDTTVGGNASQGVAYVFVRSGTTWAQQGTALTALDGAKYDSFGAAVGLFGDTAVIKSTRGLYVFVRSGATWSQQGPVITGPDGNPFGPAIAVGEDTFIVGATTVNNFQGVAYVFTRAGGTWSQQGPALVASDGAPSSFFGCSVALSGDTALIGARGVGGHGAAYAFVRSGGVWAQQGPALTGSDTAASDQFGDAVAVSGDTALVGASNKTIGNVAQLGAAYVFVRNGTTWAQQGNRLVDPNGVPPQGNQGDFFGRTLALSGDHAVIGARAMTAGTQGTAHIFVRSSGVWAPEGTVLASPNGLLGDFFSEGLGISGKTVLVGAYEDSVNGLTRRGAAYAFVLAGGACNENSECGTGFCSDHVCCDQACVGACDVCTAALGASTDGICTVLPAGSPGAPACAPSSCNGASAVCTACTKDSHCTAGTYCAANGSCLPRKSAGAACNLAKNADCKTEGCRACAGDGNGSCADGFCCSTPCDGQCDVCSQALGSPANGTCAPALEAYPGAPACPADFACNGKASFCPNVCTTDADCSLGFFCGYSGAVGRCLPQKNIGDVCVASAKGDCVEDGCRVCKSGDCVDGFCCTEACGGGCDACSVAAGASSDGTCTVLPLRSPLGQCGVNQCDGVHGACSSTCVVDLDCAQGYYCDAEGACQPQGKAGTACAGSEQCATSLSCVDGVCCNSGCAGQCEACNEPGHVGTCVPVSGTPRAPRSDCVGKAPCKGTCDGAVTPMCSYPDQATVCGAGRCTADVLQESGVCDGSGACTSSNVVRTQNCTPFGCDDEAGQCRNSCVTDADCATGATCNAAESQCVLIGDTCKDGYTVMAPDGTLTSCHGYECAAGACRAHCASSSDCAETYACVDAKCVEVEAMADGGSPTAEPSSPGARDSGGCGCRSAGAGSPAPLATFASVALLGLLVTRRRRSWQRLVVSRCHSSETQSAG